MAAVLHKIAAVFIPGDRREQYESKFRRGAFERIVREQRWGSDLSGGGSTPDYTAVTRAIIARVITDYGISSMLDAGCGDHVWMPALLDTLDNGFRYIGGDIVPELIDRHQGEHPQREFQVLDFVVDDLPQCDLIFCRDVIQHLPVRDAIKVLRNFSRSGAKYLLTTTHLRRFGWRNARDRRVGQCHDRNLLLKPFSLADPIAIFSERDPGHKFLGLWELPLQTVTGEPL